MVTKCTILDIPDIVRFIEETYEPSLQDDTIILVRNILVNGGIILSSRDKTMYLCIEVRGRYIGNGHIYTRPNVRGKPVVEFIRDCQSWGRENTTLRYIFNYTKDRKVQMLMKYVGAKRIGEYKNYVVFRQGVN